jgi:hypothetical protein
MLILGIATTGLAFLTFVFTTLIHEPASVITFVAILALSVGLDVGWTRRRAAKAAAN